MADPEILAAVFDREPEDALTYLRAKGYRTSVAWSEMLHEDHARAFTVAKVARLDLLETIRRSLDRALAEGRTFEGWKKDLVPELQKAGWWGMVEDRSLTGTADPVFVSPRRLRTIYDTNMRMSRAAGDWARYQAAKRERPYLRYSAVLDRRTRPEHARWHGTILPVDHPWWRTHFPPNGWHCRCITTSVSEAELKRRGWTVSVEPPPDLRPPRPFRGRGPNAPLLMVPDGLDPGFGYNAGIAHWRALAPRLTDEMAADTPSITPRMGPPPPEPAPARKLPAEVLLPSKLSAEQLLARNDEIVARLSSRAPIIVDPTGEPIVMSSDAWLDEQGRPKITKRDRGRFLELILRTLRQPDELWEQWVTADPTRREGGTPFLGYLARKYLARFVVDGVEEMIFVAIRVGGKGWSFQTGFPADTQRYWEAERFGTLIWRRG